MAQSHAPVTIPPGRFPPLGNTGQVPRDGGGRVRRSREAVTRAPGSSPCGN
jgi:hypothetical protein